MNIFKKISSLKNSIQETDKLVDNLIITLNEQKTKVEKKESKITILKQEVSNNIDKIDKILENYNANI